MCKRMLFVCFALLVLRFPDEVYAQFTDPRNYDNAPVGINQIAGERAAPNGRQIAGNEPHAEKQRRPIPPYETTPDRHLRNSSRQKG